MANTSKGFWAHGMAVSFDSHDVGGITSISLGGSERGDVEITDNDSQGDRQYVPGLRENGEMTIECRYVPTDAGQLALVANRNEASPTPATMVITLPPGSNPNSASDPVVLSFDCYVKGSPIELPASEETPAGRTFTLKITGPISEPDSF